MIVGSLGEVAAIHLMYGVKSEIERSELFYF